MEGTLRMKWTPRECVDDRRRPGMKVFPGRRARHREEYPCLACLASPRRFGIGPGGGLGLTAGDVTPGRWIRLDSVAKGPGTEIAIYSFNGGACCALDDVRVTATA